MQDGGLHSHLILRVLSDLHQRASLSLHHPLHQAMPVGLHLPLQQAELREAVDSALFSVHRLQTRPYLSAVHVRKVHHGGVHRSY